MRLQIDTARIEGEILVVRLSGNITRWDGPYADELFIDGLLDKGEKKLIVDLTGVDQMDSSGVQFLYACDSAVRNAGAVLRFTGANARVARLFQITRLDAVLHFYPTIEAACEMFLVAGNRPPGRQR